MLSKIRAKLQFIQEITKSKKFEEYYIIINTLFCILGWYYNQFLGFYLLIISTILSILVTNDLKLSISPLLLMVFTINKGFDADKLPLSFIIMAIITFIVLIIYLSISKINLKKIKSIKGLIGLCIFTIIPIFWYSPQNKDQVMFYFLYFTYILYLLIYFIVVIGCKQECLQILIKSLSYISILISLQVIITISRLYFDETNVLSINYYIGWGMCNEAGIMICFSIPFLFILLKKSSSVREKLFRVCLLFVTIPGIILTASRGAYILYLLTILSCSIYLFVCSKDKKKIIFISSVIFTAIIVLVLVNIKSTIKYVKSILDSVFNIGLSLNGRDVLWKEAWLLFTQSFRNILFGSGTVSIVRDTITANGWKPGQVVFHSTLFQTLVMSGLCGLICLVVHLVEKYKLIKHLDKDEYVLILISFILIDLYGLMDNTYHMFYYMIPLLILIACIDSDLYLKNNSRE
ncbi:MAG: O-antigen ligase family protein [Bacilli bacterium]|uniref:O-antigen ligase family protein n=1 Tax=Intestinibacter sp. TaxID=1965304 RepID=UPI003F0C22EC